MLLLLLYEELLFLKLSSMNHQELHYNETCLISNL